MINNGCAVDMLEGLSCVIVKEKGFVLVPSPDARYHQQMVLVGGELVLQ